jgi:putative endopeptidase
VGQDYVARHFPPAHKARMRGLITNLLAAYGESIDGLSWMSPQTKEQAAAKLAKYERKIGYPDKWRDYSRSRSATATPSATRCAPDASSASASPRGRQAGRPHRVGDDAADGQRVLQPEPERDRVSGRDPRAAVLQHGRRRRDQLRRDRAIIGHEISHGFDDTGSQYDGDGRLRDWWTEADRKAFAALGDRLVAQFDTYEPCRDTRSTAG